MKLNTNKIFILTGAVLSVLTILTMFFPMFSPASGLDMIKLMFQGAPFDFVAFVTLIAYMLVLVLAAVNIVLTILYFCGFKLNKWLLYCVYALFALEIIFAIFAVILAISGIEGETVTPSWCVWISLVAVAGTSVLQFLALRREKKA